MTVQNLQAGGIKDVQAGEILGNVNVYRTKDGYDGNGSVGWQPTGGVLQQQDLAVGGIATFNVAGASGMLANATPSRVQLLWNDNVAMDERGIRKSGAANFMRRAKARASATTNTVAQALSTLNAQWYNQVVKGCGLDASTFQLVQGSQPLGTTSEQLWNIADVVPPLSVSTFYNPSQANVFSTDYGAIINNLKPQNVTTFQNVMGDYYSSWMAYLKTNPPLPKDGSILTLFQNWSQMNMPPGQAQSALTAWQQVAQGAVPIAVQLWLQAGGGASGTKAYNGTIEQLTNALQSAQAKSFSYSTETASSDISNTWAETEAAGLFDIFEGGGESSYSDYSAAFAFSSMAISATFQKVVTFPLAPLAKPSSDPILSQFQPWYSSEALNLAYQHQDNTVWNNNPPSWNDTFGPSGNMQRTASALIVVDGVSITIESSAAFAAEDQAKVQTAVEAGFWPFFEVEVAGGWSNSVAFDTQGRATVTCNSQLGNPVILGVIVTPIEGLLSAS